MNKKSPFYKNLFLGCLFLVSGSISAASSDYQDLVQLFQEFREFQEAKLTNGVPDYTPAAMEEQYRGLKEFQQQLAKFEIESWPINKKVDYHLVRAEMNALEFHHKEHKPWARDPDFYSMMQGDAGASVNVPEFFLPLFDLLGFSEFGPPPSDDKADAPLSKEQQARIQATLVAVPKLYEQARSKILPSLPPTSLSLLSGTTAGNALFMRK